MAIPDHHKCVQMHKRLRESYRESRSIRIRQFPKGKRHKGKIKAWQKFRIRVIINLEHDMHEKLLRKKYGCTTRREHMFHLGFRNKYWKYGKYDD